MKNIYEALEKLVFHVIGAVRDKTLQWNCAVCGYPDRSAGVVTSATSFSCSKSKFSFRFLCRVKARRVTVQYVQLSGKIF